MAAMTPARRKPRQDYVYPRICSFHSSALGTSLHRSFLPEAMKLPTLKNLSTCCLARSSGKCDKAIAAN